MISNADSSLRGLQKDGIAFFTGFHGIIDKIDQKAFEKISVQHPLLPGGSRFQSHSFFFKLVLLQLRHSGEEFFDIHFLHPYAVVIIQSYQAHELAGKSFQPAAFLVDMEQRLILTLLVHFYMKQGIRIADDGCHRGFHFMGKAAQQLLLLPGNLFQLCDLLFYSVRHPVKGTCHLSDFIMGFYPGAPVKNALADIESGLLQLPQRGQHPSCQQENKQHRYDCRRQIKFQEKHDLLLHIPVNLRDIRHQHKPVIRRGIHGNFFSHNQEPFPFHLPGIHGRLRLSPSFILRIDQFEIRKVAENFSLFS